MSNDFPTLAPVLEELARQHYPDATLYVIATPIGNIADISLRALKLMSLVDAIACEDTRNTSLLLRRYDISKQLIAAHEHNEQEAAAQLIARLHKGERIAYVSDAGTPAVSDPGAKIVAAVHAAGLKVVSIPGASAAVAALAGAGMLNDHFYFAGFLPSKAKQREAALNALRAQSASLVFYEAPHRIRETVDALLAAFGPARHIVFARELTKLFEEIHRCTLGDAPAWLLADAHRQKGEFVLVVEGASAQRDMDADDSDRILKILLSECPVKQAASLAAQLTGQKKNALYERALQLKDAQSDQR